MNQSESSSSLVHTSTSLPLEDTKKEILEVANPTTNQSGVQDQNQQIQEKKETHIENTPSISEPPLQTASHVDTQAVEVTTSLQTAEQTEDSVNRPKLQKLPKDEILSPEDKIEDLKEVVNLFKPRLEEIYKNKFLSGNYGTSKIDDLQDDAKEYLQDPEKFIKNTDPAIVKNTKDFLEEVKKIRDQEEVP